MILGLAYILLVITGLLKPNSKAVTWGIFLFTWVIIGLNTFTPDYATYKFVYEMVSKGMALDEFEPLFTLLMFVCGKAGLPFQGFRMVYAGIYAILALATVRRLTNNRNVNAVLSLFMLWPLITNVSGIRFALAAMVVCYFVPELIENKGKKGIVKFLIGIGIAFFIHMTSVFYLVLLFARKRMTTFKQLGVYSVVVAAILVLFSDIPRIVISLLFSGATAQKLTKWLVLSSDMGYEHNSFFGFLAFSLFVIAFTVLVSMISKRVIRAYRRDSECDNERLQRITLYRNISYCLLFIIPGFAIAGEYQRFLFGILPVYYSVFAGMHKYRLIGKRTRTLYSFLFVMLVLCEIGFYMYSNMVVSQNFNLLDVFENNLLIK